MNLKLPHITATPRTYDFFFRIGMWWRIVYGVFRFILGLVLLRMIDTPIADILRKLFWREIIEDPSDIVLQSANPLLHHMPFTVTYFLVAYLIFWGVVDIFLSINLLKHRMWAFPVSMYIISVFVLYEIYRFAHTHSLVLASVIVVDIILVWLIGKEYRNLHTAEVRAHIDGVR